MQVFTILDTDISDTGLIQKTPVEFLRADKPLRFSPDLGDGDSIELQGRSEPSAKWNTIYTFDEDKPIDVYVGNQFRAIRAGGSGSSKLYMEYPYLIENKPSEFKNHE